MASAIKEMRERAKKAGIPVSEIRGASADELQTMLNAGSSSNGPVKKTVAKKAVRKNVSRKAAPARKATTTARKKSAPAKSRKSGTAKRQTTQTRSEGKGRRVVSASGVEYTTYYEPKGTRNVIEEIDYNVTDGWSPREGSVPDRIIKALKSSKGNREKAFDKLLPKIGELVPKTTRVGRKMNKAEHEAMLRYRISSTAWRFALQTGQHEKAEGRVEYGTGGTGAGLYKRQKAQKAAPRKAARKPARKATAAKKPAQRRKASPAAKAVAARRKK